MYYLIEIYEITIFWTADKDTAVSLFMDIFFYVHYSTYLEPFINQIFLLQPEEDVSQFRFSKFAATYFQGGASPLYVRRPLKQSLLPLSSEADSMVSVWTYAGKSVELHKPCRSSISLKKFDVIKCFVNPFIPNSNQTEQSWKLQVPFCKLIL